MKSIVFTLSDNIFEWSASELVALHSLYLKGWQLLLSEQIHDICLGLLYFCSFCSDKILARIRRDVLGKEVF